VLKTLALDDPSLQEEKRSVHSRMLDGNSSPPEVISLIRDPDAPTQTPHDDVAAPGWQSTAM